MSTQDLIWENPGRCPSCGVVTQHTWYKVTSGEFSAPVAGKLIEPVIHGKQGQLRVSKCASPQCGALALWMARTVSNLKPGPHSKLNRGSSGSISARETFVSMVYPQAGVRIPPADGLNEEEARLYKEAAAVAPMSPRAGCALVRVLLEAYLKRYLVDAGHTADGKSLVKLIGLAVNHLDLSSNLRNGLESIRNRGNSAVHDPYGLTDDTRSEDLEWLFRAVDELVDDLHVKPQKWAGMAET